MKYKDGAALFRENASEWAMSIFFESVNGAYGFMERYMYNFLVGEKVEQEDKEFIYIPEEELLDRILSGNQIIDFTGVYQDCKSNTPDRMPWLEKIRYRGILSKQLDLDPALCENALEIHERRKILAIRWFQSLKPYIENYQLSCQSFYPGVISSTVAKLSRSVLLLTEKDLKLGRNDLQELRNFIDMNVKKII